jgi:hypothetical protein
MLYIHGSGEKKADFQDTAQFFPRARDLLEEWHIGLRGFRLNLCGIAFP